MTSMIISGHWRAKAAPHQPLYDSGRWFPSQGASRKACFHVLQPLAAIAPCNPGNAFLSQLQSGCAAMRGAQALHQPPHMWQPGAAAAAPTALLTLTVELLEAPRRPAPDLYLDKSSNLAKNLLLSRCVSLLRPATPLQAPAMQRLPGFESTVKMLKAPWRPTFASTSAAAWRKIFCSQGVSRCYGLQHPSRPQRCNGSLALRAL